jgi:hypothetical protein
MSCETSNADRALLAQWKWIYRAKPLHELLALTAGLALAMGCASQQTSSSIPTQPPAQSEQSQQQT